MILTTTDSLDGKTITQYLGMVSSIMPAAYTGSQKMMANVHHKYMETAQAALEQEAVSLGADAVIGIKYAAMGNHHVLVGTAVKLG